MTLFSIIMEKSENANDNFASEAEESIAFSCDENSCGFPDIEAE